MEEFHDFSLAESADNTVHSGIENAGLSFADIMPMKMAEATLDNPESTRIENRLDELSSEYGVQSRMDGDNVEFFYQADGEEHIVHSSDSSIVGLDSSQRALERIRQEKMQRLESTYKVMFAPEGTPSFPKYSRDENCKYQQIGQTKAVTPDLRQLHAVEEGLKRVTPSQLTADGRYGMQIFFVDKNPIDPPYGDKPALGLYNDRTPSGIPALVVTPEGGALPTTEKDRPDPDGRDLKGVVMHEVIHNSVHNQFPNGGIPKDLVEAMGWAYGGTHHFLKSENEGESFVHLQLRNCKLKDWIKLTNNVPLTEDGELARDLTKAQTLSNEEVMDRAVLEPATYYFPNPEEMLVEIITEFRKGEESRAELMRDHPEFYHIAKQYDAMELGRTYGVSNGRTRAMRLPEGFVVRRDERAEEILRKFEAGN